jgi:hypothetical protein
VLCLLLALSRVLRFVVNFTEPSHLAVSERGGVVGSGCGGQKGQRR